MEAASSLASSNVIFGGIKVAGFVVLLDGNDEKKTKRLFCIACLPFHGIGTLASSSEIYGAPFSNTGPTNWFSKDAQLGEETYGMVDSVKRFRLQNLRRLLFRL